MNGEMNGTMNRTMNGTKLTPTRNGSRGSGSQNSDRQGNLAKALKVTVAELVE